MGFVYFIIGSIVCIWYFNLNTEKQGETSKTEIAESIWRAFRFHPGSLAYGSIMI